MLLGELLARLHMSKAAFAALIGVERATVSRWLSGDRKPSRSEAAKLAEYGIQLPHGTKPFLALPRGDFMRRTSTADRAAARPSSPTPPISTSGAAQPLSPERQACAELGSTLFSRAIENCRLSNAQVASAIGVSRERVNDWADADDPASLTLRDLLVLQRRLPTLYAEVLAQLAELSSARPFERQRREVARAVRDLRVALDRVDEDLKGTEA